MADELSVPRQTLNRWREASRQHPAELFVGQGHCRADDQRRRDWERAVHDLEEENTILKKRGALSPTASSQGRGQSRPPLPRLDHDEGFGAAGLPQRV
jgi:transposase